MSAGRAGAPSAAAPRWPPRARARPSPAGPCTSTPSRPRPARATSRAARRSPSADPDDDPSRRRRRHGCRGGRLVVAPACATCPTSRSPGSSSRTSRRCSPTRAPSRPSSRPSRTRHDGAVDLVAGVEARGFVVGAALAHALGVGFVPVRKAGKLPGETVSISYDLEYGSAEIEVHADAFVGGERVLLVDDVLATGGTAARGLGPAGARRRRRRRVRVRRRARLPRWPGPDGVPAGGSAPRRPVTGDYTPGMAEDTTTAAAGTTPPPGLSSRARARAALALVGRNKVPENPVLEPLLQVVRTTHPKADLALDRAGLRRRRARPRGPEAPLGRRLHHPPPRGDDDPRRARHDPDDAGRRAAPRHRRGHLLQPRGAAPRLR